jgi:hypothetical protein
MKVPAIVLINRWRHVSLFLHSLVTKPADCTTHIFLVPRLPVWES